MVKKKIFWILFCVVIFSLTAYFTYNTGSKLYRYYTLNQRAPIEVHDVSVSQLKRDQYVLMAAFTYWANGVEYSAEKPLAKTYPNPWIAEKEKERAQAHPQSCFYSKKRPQIVALSKNFPLKSLVSSAILLGLGIYFCGLGVYVAKRQ